MEKLIETYLVESGIEVKDGKIRKSDLARAQHVLAGWDSEKDMATELYDTIAPQWRLSPEAKKELRKEAIELVKGKPFKTMSWGDKAWDELMEKLMDSASSSATHDDD